MVCVVFGLVVAFVAQCTRAQMEWNTAASQGWAQGNNAWRNTFGQGNSNAWGNLFRPQQQQNRYATCIGLNTNGDQMRLTFENGDQQSQNLWRNDWGQNLRLRVVVTSSQQSNLRGSFRIAVTQYSRVETGCRSDTLGEILNDRTWWNQESRGLIGDPITISPGHIASSTEIVQNLQFNELLGRGVALCPTHQISGSRCHNLIPLCCKIGLDSSSATTPVNQNQNHFGQTFGSFGTQGRLNGGVNAGAFPSTVMTNPLPTGGMNSGLNGGMDTGMTGGMNAGLNNGAPNNGITGGALNGGMNSDMNSGSPSGGLNNGLNGPLGGGLLGQFSAAGR